MKRNLQGIAIILFSILLVITFENLGYDYIFDLDLEWGHLFILLGMIGLGLNYLRPKEDVDETEVIDKPIEAQIQKTRSTSRSYVILALVLIVVIGLGAGIFIAGNQYKEEKYIESFVEESHKLIEEHEVHLEETPEDYDFITYYVIGNTGYAYMLDQDLNILLHPNPDVEGKSVNDFLPHIFEDVTDQLQIGDSQLIMYEFGGVEKITYIYKDTQSNYLCIAGELRDN